MTSYDTTITLPFDERTIPLLGDLDAIHKFVMQMLPNLNGATDNARATFQTLFHLTLPGDPHHLGAGVNLTIRSNQRLNDTSVPTEPLAHNQTVKLRALIATEARDTAPDTRKIRTRPIGDTEAHDWICTRLTRYGLAVDDLKYSKARTRGNRRGQHFTVRDITAVTTIIDPVAANTMLTSGIGRGKNYGLGLPRISPN